MSRGHGTEAIRADLAADDQTEIDGGRPGRLGYRSWDRREASSPAPGGSSVEGRDEAGRWLIANESTDELVQGSPQTGDEVLQAGPALRVRGQAVADDPLEGLGQAGAPRVGIGQARGGSAPSDRRLHDPGMAPSR